MKKILSLLGFTTSIVSGISNLTANTTLSSTTDNITQETAIQNQRLAELKADYDTKFKEYRNISEKYDEMVPKYALNEITAEEYFNIQDKLSTASDEYHLAKETYDRALTDAKTS